MLTLIAIALATDWSLSDAPVDRNQAVVVWSLTDTQDQKGVDPQSTSPSAEVDTVQDASADGEVSHSVRLQQWGASWCPSCPGGKAQAQAAADQLGVRLEYFDYDQNKELARSLGVDSVPRTFIVIDGKIRHRYVGQTPAATIVGKARELSGVKPAGPLSVRVTSTTHTSSGDSGPLRMSWNFQGSWNPTTQQMINHLSEHGIDATGMTRQQMANAHDAAHGSRHITQFANRSQPVRLINRGAVCPSGRCPR